MEHAQPAGAPLGTDVHQDLQFVRAVVERGEHTEGPPAIYFLWGIVTLIGFSMVDFYPRWDGLYWAIAGPLAGVASWLILRRVLRRYGVSDHKEDVREWLQWLGMAGVIVLLSLDASARRFDGGTLGQLILLIVGYTYFLTYIRRGDRVMLAGGLTMVIGFVLLVYIHTYVWTIIGACVFIALAGGSTFAHLTRNRAHA